jgi:hypothetical protein
MTRRIGHPALTISAILYHTPEEKGVKGAEIIHPFSG